MLNNNNNVNDNNSAVMNSANDIETARNVLSEMMKQLGRNPYDMSWEELIIENEDLAKQIMIYIQYQKSAGKSKTMMCRNIIQGLQCPFGINCRFAHNEDEITPKPKLSFLKHEAPPILIKQT